MAERGMFNRTTVLVLVAALAAGLGLWAAQTFTGPRADAGPTLETVRLLPQARDIPPFSLTAADGNPLTLEQLRGRWTLVFIGFTHCPDVCPTTLAELGQAEKRWSAALPEDARPRILFVSVDPERDSPERAGEYARYFSANALAATADIPTLEHFAKSLGMVFMKTPLPGGSDPEAYTVDHSTQVALLDPQGRFAGLARPPLSPAKLGDDMATLAGAAR
jgi:protein SCO1/2